MFAPDPHKPASTERVEIVYPIPECPACGLPNLIADRTLANDDMGIIRNCTCRDCGQKIRLVLEYRQNLASG